MRRLMFVTIALGSAVAWVACPPADSGDPTPTAEPTPTATRAPTPTPSPTPTFYPCPPDPGTPSAGAQPETEPNDTTAGPDVFDEGCEWIPGLSAGTVFELAGSISDTDPQNGDNDSWCFYMPQGYRSLGYTMTWTDPATNLDVILIRPDELSLIAYADQAQGSDFSNPEEDCVVQPMDPDVEHMFRITGNGGDPTDYRLRFWLAR